MTSARVDLQSLRMILRVPAAMGVGTAALAWLALDEGHLAPAWLALAAAAAGLDLALGPLSRRSRNRHSTGEILATMALAWALIGALGTLPLVVAAALEGGAGSAMRAFDDPLSALFESVSGFTSTGLTMVSRPDELPATVQLWRSLTEWVGGAGLALAMLTLINPDRDGGDELFDSELSVAHGDSVRRVARRVWTLYVVLTAFGVGLFAACGMAWWEALNHGMTAISTGGFSVTADSFGAYGAPAQLAAMLVMLLGAVSFGVVLRAIERRDPLELAGHGPTRVLLGGIALAVGLLWLSRLEFETDAGALALPFQAVSAFATAGFSTVSLGDWHSAPLAVLIACMAIGGTSGATTGGFKTDRLLLLGRGVVWRLRRLFRTDGEGREHDVDGERLGTKDARLRVEGAATLVALWVATWLLGCLALAPVAGEDRTFTQVAFEVMSAQAGVGLSVGITDAELAPGGKWTLIALMWAGRLELIAAFALLWLPFARRALRAAR